MLIIAYTYDYMEKLPGNNLLPLSFLPTRVTEKSATIIDHIYFRPCKKYDMEMQKVFTGNITCDITDHYGNFVLLYNKTSRINMKERPEVRLYTNKNKNKFIQIIGNINWQNEVMCYDDANIAYDKFNSIYSASYEQCFPLTKVSRRGYRDKKWITSGLKKHQNTKINFI